MKNPRQKLLLNLRVLAVFLGITIGITVPAIHALIQIRGNTMLMIDNLQFTLPIISCSIRIFVFWWKKEGKYVTCTVYAHNLEDIRNLNFKLN